VYTVPLGYRLGEHVVAGLLLGACGLAVLGQLASDGRSWLFVSGLFAVAIASGAFLVPLERLRAGAPAALRHAINAALLLLLGILVWRAPLRLALDSIGDLFAGERATEVRVIRHQVYAAYRRMDLDAERRILERAEVFAPTIEAAARTFGVSAEILIGIAAAESSFYPRDSRDGGRGLFQVTAVPPAAVEAARRALAVRELDPWNQRHNAFVAAATLALYRQEMDQNIVLTLLAYNIGPRNGGLHSIMQGYGARNFAQAQPYLQALPRDYPIRVLAGALAYRVWRSRGALPSYAEGNLAREIQRIGIPGLDEGPAVEPVPTVPGRSYAGRQP
jgi:hypothetical protein